MKFTIGDIERQVRIKILDTYDDNYRFQPHEIYHATRDGIRVIWNVRPESRYVDGLLTHKMLFKENGGTKTELDFVLTETFPVEIGGTSYTHELYKGLNINMEDRWMEALVYYAIHQMYLKDDSDTANTNLAQTYYSKFEAAVRS